MSYERVIPRDLFNESSLLKCYGRVYIVLEDSGIASFAEESVRSFDVCQRSEDGGLFIENLPLLIKGVEYQLWSPLNSRAAWPLYATRTDDPDFEDVLVFDDLGNFTIEMKELCESR